MRRVAPDISGNSGSTSTAAALVLRARPPYLGLATKVISVGPASSIPFTPVISRSALPRNSAPSRLAISPSFIVEIVTERAVGGLIGLRPGYLAVPDLVCRDESWVAGSFASDRCAFRYCRVGGPSPAMLNRDPSARPRHTRNQLSERTCGPHTGRVQ